MASRPTIQAAAGAAARGDFAAALAGAEALLADDPDNPAALGLAALALIRLDRASDAIPVLRKQREIAPEDRAVRFNLASVLAASGATAEAVALSRDHAGHPALARLAGYLHQQAGELDQAIAAYRSSLDQRSEDWESWNNLGNCLSLTGDTAGAIKAFEHAINRSPKPGRPEIFLNLCQALGSIENREARLRTSSEAASRFPDHHAIAIEHGLALTGIGRTDEAVEVLRAAANREDHFGEAHLELGLLYEHANRLDDLESLIEEGDRLGRGEEFEFVRALDLKRKGRFDEAAALAERIAPRINQVRTAQLRGDIADRLGHHAEAFHQFELMNAASAAGTPDDGRPSYRDMIVQQTAEMMPSPGPAVRAEENDPIFVVGFPRSGTTLLDTLLGNLPDLKVFEERQMLAQIDSEFPGLARSTDSDEIRAARVRYFELAELFEGPSEGRRIVDKHPLHMAKLPLIDRLFPGARIVMVERHPADVTLSCFMANFLLNTAMRSFVSLEETARTYDAVFANFSKASELYPLKIHAVRYERMITDLEKEMRPLLEFLGLAWRDTVLDNQAAAARRGTVRTASYAQIGQPIYARAVGRWERYRTHLEPVMPILRPWIARLGYEAGPDLA